MCNMTQKNATTVDLFPWRNLNSHIWTDSPCDGSAILPAHAEHCVRFASKFDGEFAISLWDDCSDHILLARDVFGAKPLFFAIDSRDSSGLHDE